jgi:hypothetical protein
MGYVLTDSPHDLASKAEKSPVKPEPVFAERCVLTVDISIWANQIWLIASDKIQKILGSTGVEDGCVQVVHEARAKREATAIRRSYLSRLGVRSSQQSNAAKRSRAKLDCDFLESAVLFPSIKDESQDLLRSKLLQKLSYGGVLVPRSLRPPPHQTLIIFDWDDTLIPSSYLRCKYAGWSYIPDKERQLLKRIEEADRKLLELALSLGRTLIITNASDGWVEASTNAWMPGLLPLLQKIRIVSARSRYQDRFPNDMNKWKAAAFLEMRQQLNSETITNLVSLGDSEYEMEAAQAMGKEFQMSAVKLIKFSQLPTSEDLVKQLDLIVNQFESIVGSGSGIHVQVQWQRSRG